MIPYSTPNLKITEIDANCIHDLINSGNVSIGKCVRTLEENIQGIYGIKHAIACSNATTGLIIAIKAAGWKNLRVGVPAFTWPSTIYALECNGNIPVFCDINSKTWLMVPPTKEVDAILPVDTFGSQYTVTDDMPKVPVIMDAAHGYGLQKLGRRGIAEVISFSFTKIVTATEGGMILTNDDSIAEIARELRRLSGRMAEVNAFMAYKSMRMYKNEVQRMRSKIIDKYVNEFTFEYDCQVIPACTNDSVVAILLPTAHARDILRNELTKNCIETKVYYEPLVEGLPHTDDVYSRILALPVHAKIVEKQDEIIGIANKVMSNVHVPGKSYLKDSGYLKKYLRNE